MHRIVAQDLDRVQQRFDFRPYNGHRVFITGGSSFVGGWLARSLCFRPSALVAVSSRSLHKLHGLGLDCRLSAYQDLRQGLSDFQPDVIFHCASPGDPKDYLADMAGCADANLQMTRQILEHAKETRPTVVFVSSGEVYGTQKKFPTKEEQEASLLDVWTEPRKIYAIAKMAGEALCGAYTARWGVPTRVARLHHSYGPGMRLDDSRVVPTYVARKLKGQPLPVMGDGKAVRTYLYATDMVCGLLAVGASSQDNVVFNVGSEKPVQVSELAAAFGGTVEQVAQAKTNPRIVPDCSRLKALGWKETVTLQEGIGRTLESYT